MNMVKKVRDGKQSDSCLPIAKRTKHTQWHEHLKKFASTEGS